MFPSALDPRVEQAVRALHESPWRLVAAVTGVGAGIQNILWSVPGSSATIFDSVMPYKQLALTDFIGHAPEKFVSEATALEMASAAFARARELVIRDGDGPGRAIGLGITGAVETLRDRKGADQAFIAVRTADRTATAVVRFEKGALHRMAQGYVCDLAGIDAVLSLAGLAQAPIPAHGAISGDVGPMARDDGSLDLRVREVGPLAIDGPLFERPLILPDGTRIAATLDPARDILFPGSFHPLHFGHELMAVQAARMTGKRIVFGITGTHPDKGRIPEEELLRRAEQFRWRWPVLFTPGDALYVEKARRFPGVGMLIGADAVLGILDPRYYGGEPGRDAVLREMLSLGTRFHVVGRQVGERFVTLEDIAVPAGFDKLFLPVSGRWDVKSRDLR